MWKLAKQVGVGGRSWWVLTMGRALSRAPPIDQSGRSSSWADTEFDLGLLCTLVPNPATDSQEQPRGPTWGQLGWAVGITALSLVWGSGPPHCWGFSKGCRSRRAVSRLLVLGASRPGKGRSDSSPTPSPRGLQSQPRGV